MKSPQIGMIVLSLSGRFRMAAAHAICGIACASGQNRRLRIGRFGFVRRGAPAETEGALLAASRQEYLTPLDRFGPSEPLYGRVYRSEAGVYLLVAPHLGVNDPVFSVGWARNDYWAVQVWGFDGDGYRNDCDGFKSHVIHANPRVEFHYDEPNPKPADTAVAIELGLGGRRWKQHVAEIKAINRENGRRR